MSKVLRASAVVVAAAVAVPLWGVPSASAASSSYVPSSGAYFNSDGLRKPDASPQAPPNLTSDQADGVAKEHLAVAARAGTENKASFLLFDLLEIDPLATVSSAVLTVPLAPSADGNVNIEPAPEKVVACKAGDEGFGGDDGVALQDAPQRLCDAFSVVGKPTADGASYAFDITKLAQTWVAEMNDGVALTSEPAARATAFQVVFQPASKAKLALTYTAPAEEELDAVDTFVDTAGTTGTTGTPDLGTTFDAGSVTTDSGGFGAVAEPLISADVPLAAPESAVVAPVAAGPQTAATVPVAAMTETPLTPAPAFWLGLLALAGGLLFLALIMGDPRVPQASARQSRLSQALQARERGAPSSPGLRSARPALNF